MKVQFVVDAKTYFEVDADRLDRAKADDIVYVTIDFDRRRADFVWCGAEDNPANFPAEDDDFDAVVALWNRLGRPVDGGDGHVIGVKRFQVL